ncbi:MAG: intermembrane transport protein PqiB [Chromatiales bacterium]|nr:MAG: intermembrane transport protein PqiB [Chromatiales bacterium]
MTEATATVKPRRKVPVIWLVPIVAAVLGIWLVVYNFLTEGPEITIPFSTAEGIQPGKTKIKSLAVELGVVDSVELTEDLSRVVVKAKLERFAKPLLREDTQFWVVRPRIGPGGISGLGTILSGGYIRLEAGTGKAGQKIFTGLDAPPVTPAGTPGLAIILESARAGSVTAGDPVLYRGYRVGAVESTDFDPDSQRVSYGLFINEPFDALVTKNTRFWNASGITLKAGAEGLEVELGSLQTLLVGGVAFDLPDGVLAGDRADNGDNFALFANRQAANRKSYDNHTDYVVSFTQSVRGLAAGAPVEYRGIQVGTVQRLMIRELAEDKIQGEGDPIPVLIRIEPARLGLPDSPAAVAEIDNAIRVGLARGLRARLQTGNLLTGASIIGLDFFEDAGVAELGEFAGYREIPTLAGGIAGLEQKLNQLLAKLNDLPLEPALRDLSATLESLRATVDDIRGALNSDEAREITDSINSALREINTTLDSISPDSPAGDRLNRTLGDLNQTLRNLESLTRTLSDKPNTLIFSPPVSEDPVPQQGTSP